MVSIRIISWTKKKNQGTILKLIVICFYKVSIVHFYQMRKNVAQRSQEIVHDDPTRSSPSGDGTQKSLSPNSEIPQWHTNGFYTTLKMNAEAQVQTKQHLEQGKLELQLLFAWPLSKECCFPSLKDCETAQATIRTKQNKKRVCNRHVYGPTKHKIFTIWPFRGKSLPTPERLNPLTLEQSICL